MLIHDNFPCQIQADSDAFDLGGFWFAVKTLENVRNVGFCNSASIVFYFDSYKKVCFSGADLYAAAVLGIFYTVI